METNLHLQNLSEKPIFIPRHPFWTIFRRFGRDELLALVINVFATILAKIFFASAIILSIAGPIIEKIGFFPAHFYEARKVYKTTPEKQRKKQSYYFKKAIKGGGKSLIEDILVHDPFYIILMYVGLKVYPGTPVWILSIMSFVIAVFAVSGIELLITEINYSRLKKRMKKLGFGTEEYFESRFLIESKQSRKKLIEKISKQFNLQESFSTKYNDLYLENKFPDYSERTPKVRLRERGTPHSKNMKTLQVVYTKAKENKKKYEQYRYFPIKKEKIYYIFNKNIPKSIDDIDNKKLKSFMKKNKTKETIKKIKFVRTYARNEDLLISVDNISGKRGFYVLEIKTHKNIKLLIEGMRYIMKEFPVIQTTKNKYEISGEE